jgi:hypothetical protein
LTSITKGKPEGPPPVPRNLPLEPVVRTGRPSAVTALAASPWAPVAAVAGQKQVLLYDTDTLELVGVLPFPEGTPYVLKFSRNGKLLLAGGGHSAKSGRAVVWSVVTGERIFEVGDEMDAVLAADISADQTQIALGGPSKVVRVYSTRDGKLLHEIRKHTDWIESLEFSPDGVLLASGDRNGGLFVWEAFTAREYFSLRGHAAAVTDLSWRADANVLASASEDGTIRLWEMENGSQIKGWGAGGGALAVRYSRDGRLASCARDRLARVWDQNGAQLRAFDAFPDIALRAAFTHDGGRVIAGDWSGQIRVWNAADGKLVGELSSNPPALAERLELAAKSVAARQAAHDQATAAAQASAAAIPKMEAELAAAQKALNDQSTAAKTAEVRVAKAKESAARATAALASVQSRLTAGQVMRQAFDEAAAKIKAAADKSKGNAELVAAAEKSKLIAAQAAAEVTAAEKSVADLTASAKAATEELTTSQREAQAAVAAVAKLVETRTAALKAAQAKAAADKSAVEQAGQALDAARAAVEHCRTALAAKSVRK